MTYDKWQATGPGVLIETTSSPCDRKMSYPARFNPDAASWMVWTQLPSVTTEDHKNRPQTFLLTQTQSLRGTVRRKQKCVYFFKAWVILISQTLKNRQSAPLDHGVALR